MRILVPLIPALCLSLSFLGCSGGGGITTPITPVVTNSIALQLSSSTLTIPEGSSAGSNITLVRTGTTGSVSFSVTGLPAGPPSHT